ncbi:MAG: hypothetical protein ACOVQ5_10440 [Flavobacteriales bacterium]|jgi:hypothetical protein
MKQKQSFYIGLISIIILTSSCRQKEDYEFKIVNNTDYKIDILEFNDDEFEIGPRGESNSFSRNLVHNCICFTNPQTSIGVKKFSDGQNTYEHSLGFSVVTAKFKSKNIIEINLTSDPEFPTAVFDINISN